MVDGSHDDLAWPGASVDQLADGRQARASHDDHLVHRSITRPGVPLSDPPAGATPIPGLGTGAYLERLAAGNFTLYVGLSPEAGVLAVEVNNSDGKDHTDEAVNVAKAVLPKLGG